MMRGPRFVTNGFSWRSIFANSLGRFFANVLAIVLPTPFSRLSYYCYYYLLRSLKLGTNEAGRDDGGDAAVDASSS